MIQSFIAEPEAFASSLGMTRVKRSAHGKAFHFNAMGVEVCLDYKDPSNKLKGGKLDVTIDNLHRHIPYAKIEKTKLSIIFDGGAKTTDGLFELTVDYELNHRNKEVGQLLLVRFKAGGKYHTIITAAPKRKSGDFKIIEGFKLEISSDHEKHLTGTFHYNDGTGIFDHEPAYEITVDRIPMKQIVATIKVEDRVYKIQGDLDLAAHTLDANVLQNNVEVAKLKADHDSSAADYSLHANLKIVGTGSVRAQLNGTKDFTNTDFEVRFNDKVVVATKTRAKLTSTMMKAELRYVGMGKIGEGKLKFAVNKEGFMFNYEPKTGLDLKISMKRVVKGNVVEWKGLVTRNDNEYLRYDNKITRRTKPDAYTVDAESKFYVSEKSKLYPLFCTYGCFNDRTMNAKIVVEKVEPYKIYVHVDLKKDNVNVLSLEMNSRQNPYFIKIVAPRILPKLSSTGRESVELTVDHRWGQYIKVNSNFLFKTFSVEKTGKGDERKITLDGKELIRGAASMGKNEISNSVTLPDGKSLTTTIKWKHDDLKCNKVEIKLDGTDRKLDAQMEWDAKNPAAITFKVDIKGENPRWGKYELRRQGTFGAVQSKLTADWTGFSNFQNVPWPSPVNTKLNASLDFDKNDFVLKASKEAAGKTMAISFNNGRLSVDF